MKLISRRDFLKLGGLIAANASNPASLIKLLEKSFFQDLIAELVQGLDYLNKIASPPLEEIAEGHPYKITSEYNPEIDCFLPTRVNFNSNDLDQEKVREAYDTFRKFVQYLPQILGITKQLALKDLKRVFPAEVAEAFDYINRENLPLEEASDHFVSTFAPENDGLFEDLLYHSIKRPFFGKFLANRVKALSRWAPEMPSEVLSDVRSYFRNKEFEKIQKISKCFERFVPVTNEQIEKKPDSSSGEQEIPVNLKQPSEVLREPTFGSDDYHRCIFATRHCRAEGVPEDNPFKPRIGIRGISPNS